MSPLSTVDVHFTVIVLCCMVCCGCLWVFVIYRVIVAMRFLVLGSCFWGFAVLGGVCIILRGVFLGICWDTLAF
jgi:hypothetical protein